MARLGDKVCITIITWVPGTEAHRITFVISVQGRVQAIFFTPWSREDGSEATFESCVARHAWETLDEELSLFGPFMTEFVIEADDNNDSTIGSYVQSRMPLIEEAGKLLFSPRASPFHYP